MKFLNKVTIVALCAQTLLLSPSASRIAFADDQATGPGVEKVSDEDVDAAFKQAKDECADTCSEYEIYLRGREILAQDGYFLPADGKIPSPSRFTGIKKELKSIRLKEVGVGGVYDMQTGRGLRAHATLATKNLELKQDYRIGASTTGTVLPYARIDLTKPGGVGKQLTARIKDPITGESYKAEWADKVSFLHDTAMGIGWQFSVSRDLVIPLGDSGVVLGAGFEGGVRQSKNWFMLPFAQANGKMAYVQCKESATGSDKICGNLTFGAGAGFPLVQFSAEMGADYTHKFDENAAIKDLSVGAGSRVIVIDSAVDGTQGAGQLGVGVSGRF